MNPLKAILCILLFFAATLSMKADDIVFHEGKAFHRFEIPFYVFAEYTPQVALRMEYARHEILNPEDWDAVSNLNVPYEIDLVFTRYPKDLAAWRTDYHELLSNRLNTLFALDTSFRAEDIRWNMILQTQCSTEELAIKYFHGFVVKYRPREVRVVEEINSAADLRGVLEGYTVTRDSTVIRIMERNTHWKKMLVVVDWTASMYSFGAQLLLWHKLNLSFSDGRVSHFVFFNDGNRKRAREKKIGKTGGIYHCDQSDLSGILETMEKVMRNGNGGEIPENDLEAIRKSMLLLDDYEDIVLIADNKSGVRDMPLLKNLDKPIHIILCDVKDDGFIHPDYIQIAFHTGGTLHTMEKDIEILTELKAHKSLSVGNMTYQLRDSALVRIR